ncbi:MAG: carboxymuconolactone decarboxylase family protein [Chloroflexi bacterium]|nr:MAG: carboxymuconolactone decarboxylase family protein [Chloroflexota bacterium]
MRLVWCAWARAGDNLNLRPNFATERESTQLMDSETRKNQLLEKYNRRAIETGMRLQGEFFLRLVHEFDELDPEWTQVWLTWIYDHMYNRRKLDDKTRVLIIIGECVVADEAVQLPNHIRSALRMGATPDEIQEVILQAHIYAGMPRMIKGMRIFRELMRDLGLLNLTDPPFRGDAREPDLATNGPQ